ncbi:pentatricopeptide repeat-containing protein MRL1, chloroplastic isoform X4 [Phoenix dactylifera]|uniref:Pentatricopeptide repeat-containing protein MRL1, chloroplastic isoform X4 n=1 Tax=Phoenix dactylifera TaxID=42345 RepID=A0A8B8ZP21_PHODC|nr:pentatricopeptide repeat-containing protein MRL1, chloroplastic isoform X4 [Phoenix dactylifera]
MDISFSPRSQTLISCLSLLSTTTSSSSFVHLPLPSSIIRKEFPGCGSQRRPSGLRSRKRCRKLGFQFQSPRCLIQDSLGENSVLVAAAAVATFAAALQVMYSRQRRESSQFAIHEVPDVMVNVGLSESHHAEPIMYKENSTLARDQANVSPEICASDIKDAQLLKLQEIFSNTLSNEVQPASKLPAFILTDNASAKTTGTEEFECSSSEVHKIDALEKDDSGKKLPDLLPGKQRQAVGVSDAPDIIVEPTFRFCSSVLVEKKQAEINQDIELDCIVAKGSELRPSSCNGLMKQDAKAVYAYNKEMPEVRSISCFESLSAGPLHLILQDNNSSYSRLRHAVKFGGIHAKISPLSAEGQKPSACFNEGRTSKGEKIGKHHGFTRDMGRSLRHGNEDNANLSGFPEPNGNLVKGANYPSGYLRAYDRLLRDGSRLRDCVDLLESMERKGLLDMDKVIPLSCILSPVCLLIDFCQFFQVHHTSFLKACKSQKAVKEAFRFCKLIRNPSMSTFNMLLSVCASSQDFDGAFQVMLLIKDAGLKPDCKLYTTLISTCAKSGKVDAMFEIFHEMVNAGIEPNVNTYGALIDGCARAGQVAKAFGAYGIMRSKKVQPDRVVFNALITACGESGAVDRAFDVLAEMRAEPKPIDPDHVTIGALMKTCIQANQVDRAHEVYKMLHEYNIKGTPEVYTIAVKSCSQTCDLEFALRIYDDMERNGVVPDEMFLSTLIDVAGHAGKVDAAFRILQDAKNKGLQVGHVSYSSLMGACCNAKNWQKALELYEEIKAIKLLPTVSMLNALITSLCDGDQILKSVEVLDEVKKLGVCPNVITYSVLIVECEKAGEAELGFTLLGQAKTDGILPNLIMCRCLTGLCLRSFEKACSGGEPIVAFNYGRPQIDNKWTSLAIKVYRETISAGVKPTIEVFSQVLGCLQFPRDSSFRKKIIENLGISLDTSRCSNISSLLDGFGEYDTRSFSILEEAASLGVVSRVSFKESPILVDARKLEIHTVEVYLLTILKGLKHRLAAGARLPNITIVLPTEKTQIQSSEGEKTIIVAGSVCGRRLLQVTTYEIFCCNTCQEAGMKTFASCP